MPASDAFDAAALREQLSGRVVTAADPDWDGARQAFNLTVDQRPAAVALPADPDDVAAVLGFARASGLRVAPQRTGHNAGPLGALDGTLLLRTDAMQGIDIDLDRRKLRARAGAKWGDVVPAAAEFGLVALHGSSPNVGVVGYSLGGGMGWYARKWGFAANSVTALELVTADGRALRADAENEPELFWALRGGGGSFGVVTALECALFPVREVYAGSFFYPWERSSEVLHTWHGLLPGLPDEITSVGRIMQFPPLPQVPEPMRGQAFAVVQAALLGDEAHGGELLAPLRELGPAMDTFAMVPPPALAGLHMDPPDPVPAISGHQLLGDLPAAAIDELVAVAGPGSGSPLVSVELRHTGGAVGRSQPGDGAQSGIPGSLSMFGVGIAAGPDVAAAVGAHLARVAATLAPHEVGRLTNFVEAPVDTSSLYPPDTYRRLQAVKETFDPDGLLLANHAVAAGG